MPLCKPSPLRTASTPPCAPAGGRWWVAAVARRPPPAPASQSTRLPSKRCAAYSRRSTCGRSRSATTPTPRSSSTTGGHRSPPPWCTPPGSPSAVTNTLAGGLPCGMPPTTPTSWPASPGRTAATPRARRHPQDAHRRPLTGEAEKAARRSLDETARESLQRTVPDPGRACAGRHRFPRPSPRPRLARTRAPRRRRRVDGECGGAARRPCGLRCPTGVVRRLDSRLRPVPAEGS